MVSFTNQQLLADLYERWFDLADANHDGLVSGHEAVAFFMPKAGLSQETLSNIWTAGSRGAPDLDKGSFRTICQLIWYAQNNGSQLPPNSAGVVSKIVSGVATFPPPKLMGLPVHSNLERMDPVGVVMPSVVGFGTGPTGAPPRPPAYSTGPTGGMPREFLPNQPWHPQGSGQFAPGQLAGFTAGPTGQFGSGYTGQVPIVAAPRPDQFGAAPTGQPDYPAITPALAQKYANGWKAAQKDAEGNIPGAAVLGLVASVPLDRSVKKAAWDLLAGQKSFLTTHQLFTIFYLLDLYPTRGSLPSSVPEGVFPPGVHMCYQAAGVPLPLALQPKYTPTIPVSQQNPVENLQLSNPGNTTAWTMNAHAPKALDPYQAMPTLGPKMTYVPPKDPPVYNPEGRLPQLDMAMLSSMSQTAEGRRIQQEYAAATEKDRAVKAAEDQLSAAKRESDFYTSALQELTLFKGRSERTLLDMQSRADSAQREAEQQRTRYEQVYEGARRATSQNQELQDAMTTAVRNKAEWESKLAVLQQELQSLAAATPETLHQLEAEAVAVTEAVRQAELDKARFVMQTEGLRESNARMEQRLSQLKDQIEAAQANQKTAAEQMDEMSLKLTAAKTSEEALELGEALVKVAETYKQLHGKCKEAALPVPEAAVLGSNAELVWHEDNFLGAKNWTDFDNAGWTLVENLPGLPDAFCYAYFITTAQPKAPKAAEPASPVAAANPYGPQADAFAGMVKKQGNTAAQSASEASSTGPAQPPVGSAAQAPGSLPDVSARAAVPSPAAPAVPAAPLGSGNLLNTFPSGGSGTGSQAASVGQEGWAAF